MDGDSELAAEGKIIFENGVPDENIAACQACHGPEAQGVRQNRASAAFLQLSQASARAMEPGPRRWGYLCRKSGGLWPNQIAALASYLSFVGGEFSEIGRGACSNCIGYCRGK